MSLDYMISATDNFSATFDIFEEKLNSLTSGLTVMQGVNPLGGFSQSLVDTTTSVITTADTIRNELDTAFNGLLLPLSGISSALGENVNPAIQSVILNAISMTQTFMGLYTNTLNLVSQFGQLALSVTSIISKLGSLSTVLAAVNWPLVAIIAGIALLVAAFIWAWNNVDGFREVVMVTFEKIKSVIMSVLTIVIQFLREKLAMIQAFWAENGELIMEAVKNVFGFILSVVEFIMPAVQWLIEATWGAIKNIIDGTLNVVMGLIKVFSGLFTGDWSTMWEGIKQVFTGILEAIWGFFQFTFIGRMLKIAGSFIELFRDSFTKGLDGVRNFFMDTFNKVLDFFSSLKQSFYDAGSGLINMLKEGIMNAANAVMDAVRNIAQKVRNLLPSSPAKEGPLSDLDKLDFASPISDSIRRGLPEVQASMSHMFSIPEMSASPALAGSGGRGGSPIVINVKATDFTDPAHVHKMARIFGNEIGFMIGGKR